MHRAIYVFLPLFAGVSAAQAQPQAPWRISEVSGDVRIAEGNSSRPATRGALLSNGSVIAGARSRAVLVRGRQYVVVSPNSRLRLGAQSQRGGGSNAAMIQVILDTGNAVFRVDRREAPHFRVQTPYLAAVVRGTTFTVTVSEAGSSVQVTEGAVEVSTLDDGASHLVHPGAIATVGSSDLYRLSISGDENRTIRSPRAPENRGSTVSTTLPQQQAAQSARITGPVGEVPLGLGDATGGLLEGEAAVTFALADVEDIAVGGADGEDSDRGHGNDDDGVDEQNPGRGSGGEGNPGRGNNEEENPGRGNDEEENPGRGNGEDEDPGRGSPDNVNPGRGNDRDDDNPDRGNDRDGDHPGRDHPGRPPR